MKRLLLILVAFVILAWAPTTTTVTAAADWITICQEDVGRFTTVGFKLHNTGSNPLTDCRIQTWVGPSATDDWLDYYTWTTCKTLAKDAMTIFEMSGNCQEKMRVQVKSTAGTTMYCRPYGVQ